MTGAPYPLVCVDLLAGCQAIAAMSDWLADHPELADRARSSGGTAALIALGPTDDSFAELARGVVAAAPADCEVKLLGSNTIARLYVHWTDSVYLAISGPCAVADALSLHDVIEARR